MPDNLGSVFSAIAFKRLALVDLPRRGSHQHEIDGVTTLRAFFETENKISGNINWHYFSDETEHLHVTGEFTFYDARAKSADRTGRSEWRMYYTDDFLDCAEPDDVLILARTLNGIIFGLVFENDSAWLRSAQILFQIGEFTPRFELLTEENLDEQELEFVKREILDELGLEISLPLSDTDEELASQELAKAIEAGIPFPTTRRMSELAQSLITVDFRDGDTALVELLDREERLFRAIEKIIVENKLQQGFDSVDDFISYSLSVQNRRKSRMGLALQNHLTKIFTESQLRFDAQVITEGKSKPDFIFPGASEYHNNDYVANLLVMLAAKSSCKERWRQILDEADRIPNKHLCTLEQAISVDQTRAMINRSVTLVIPSEFHRTYLPEQQENIWSINQFIDYVRSTQS